MSPSWLRIGAVARRNLVTMYRSPHRLFDITIWPVFDVLLFGTLGAYSAQSGTTHGQATGAYLLAGIVLWHVVYQSSIAVSTGFLEETWSRNLLNLMVSPLREWEFAAGVALTGMVKVFIGTGIVVLGAFALFAFDVTDVGLTLVPVAAILLVVGWLIAVVVIGLILRFGQGAEAMAWGILFLTLPLSGAFYPVESLPAVARPISRVLPTTAAYEALRAVLDGKAVPWDRLGLAAASSAAFAFIALVFLTRMLAAFRRRGFITRYS